MSHHEPRDPIGWLINISDSGCAVICLAVILVFGFAIFGPFLVYWLLGMMP